MLGISLTMLLGGVLLMLRLSPGGSFPSPLSAEDERRYLLLWQDGDIAARNVLVEHNLRLVAHIVKKYYTQTNDIEDLISIGTIGLIKGINTYKPDRGIRLATYASRCIENAILSQRKNRQLRWRNGRLLKQNGACWREWESAAIFFFPTYRVQ